jgi:WhiB family transcriptional regulator, redox-sensing transcriptional regulator
METTVALPSFTGFGSSAHVHSPGVVSIIHTHSTAHTDDHSNDHSDPHTDDHADTSDEHDLEPRLAPPSAQQPNTNLSLSSAVGSSQLGRWNDGTWRLDAACSTMDTLIFFPIGETGPATPQVTLAKKICASCPVREQCLEFAIATIQNDGIWGGTTEDERRLIKRARRAAARKAAARTAS